MNTNSIATLAFNLGGHLLALGGLDGIINVWSESSINNVLALGGIDGITNVWNLKAPLTT